MRKPVLAALGAALLLAACASTNKSAVSNAAKSAAAAKAQASATTVQAAKTATTAVTPTTEAVQQVSFNGTGDDVVDLAPASKIDVGAIYVKGNAGASFFAVKGLDSFGKDTDLFVNTTSAYEGIRPFDFAKDQHTVRLQVQATGPWHIEIRPLRLLHVLNSPGTMTGHGDDVLVVTGATPDTAKITGNKGASFFGVKSFGSSEGLLVNTTDPYDGKVVIPSDANKIISVQAEGDWTISLPG